MPKQNAVVFDDDDLFQILFKRILNTLDVEVKSFANPDLYFCSQPGVDSCPVAVPCVDFLLTDHMMPDMTGLEFLRRARQIGCKIPDCRKAIISGNWTDEDIKKAKLLVKHVFDKSDAVKQISAWVGEVRGE